MTVSLYQTRYKSTMASHQDRLIAFLKKDVGGANLSNEQIREFSKNLKELEILDLSRSSTAQWVTQDEVGQSTLITLVTWYSLGLLQKITDIKKITKDK